MIRLRLAAVLFWGYAVILTTLLVVPDAARFLLLPEEKAERLDRSLASMDKPMHASGYFLLMLLAAAAYRSTSAGIGIVWLLAGGAAHGALTELVQWAVPPREANWRDFIADVVGLGLGALVWRLFRRSAPSRDGTEQEVQR